MKKTDNILAEMAYPSVTEKQRVKAEDDLHQATRTILTCAETRAEAEQLFGEMGDSSRKSRKLLEKLFIQTPGAETMAPQLVEKIASATSTFFEKNASQFGMTEAQRRFPELLKVASSRKILKKTLDAAPIGSSVPTRPHLAGGSS